MTPEILLTGADGFIGSALCARLAAGGAAFRALALDEAASERIRRITNGRAAVTITGDLASYRSWKPALHGVDVIIHLAGRAHVMRETVKDPLHEFRRVNTQGTLELAQAAAAEGVRRFIFISTSKVHGESSPGGRPFTELDEPQPGDAYAVSKWEAELGLRQIGRESAMEITAIRPVVVYGPGVRGNIATLLKWASYGLPLPIRNIQNRRSLLGVGNLCDFLLRCAQAPALKRNAYLISDGADLSTPELYRKVAFALQRSARMFPARWGCWRRPARSRDLESCTKGFSTLSP